MLLNEIRISDLDAASGMQIKNSKEDYSKIELLLRGGTESVTLSTGKTITKAQMLADANGNQTVLDNARIRVTGILQV